MKKTRIDTPVLNIAAICTRTKVLGPGTRFGIWVQGCCFDCCHCVSPEWREMKRATLIAPRDLSEKILMTAGITGITISGGEPMLQSAGLYRLVKKIRSSRALTIICYTGFTVEELINQKNSCIDAFLSEIDVLIDGPYVEELNNNKGLRGSSNQRIHILSEAYKDYIDYFFTKQRDIEIHLFRNEYLVVGIEPKKMKNFVI